VEWIHLAYDWIERRFLPNIVINTRVPKLKANVFSNSGVRTGGLLGCVAGIDTWEDRSALVFRVIVCKTTT
jgi:hypothetical protein